MHFFFTPEARILTHVSVTHSYESIYAACQALITLYNKGEGIYGNLKINLEQSLGHLADHKTFWAEFRVRVYEKSAFPDGQRQLFRPIYRAFFPTSVGSPATYYYRLRASFRPIYRAQFLT